MSNVFQVFIQPIKNIRSCIIAHVTNVRDFCDSYMTSKFFLPKIILRQVYFLNMILFFFLISELK